MWVSFVSVLFELESFGRSFQFDYFLDLHMFTTCLSPWRLFEMKRKGKGRRARRHQIPPSLSLSN